MTQKTPPSNTVAIYVGAVVVLGVITVGAVVAILAIRPTADNTPLIAALIGFVTPVMLGLLALVQRENHLAMNSRLDQLLAATNATSRAEGAIEGAASERATPTHQGPPP